MSTYNANNGLLHISRKMTLALVQNESKNLFIMLHTGQKYIKNQCRAISSKSLIGIRQEREY